MKPQEILEPAGEADQAQQNQKPSRKAGLRWKLPLLAACLILTLAGLLLPTASYHVKAQVPPTPAVSQDYSKSGTIIAAPADGTTMETVVQELMDQYGLNEDNFSLCYYNTVTGESYEYNPDAWMVAASTYKLPLNLYYYEQEAAGAIDPESYVNGIPLPDIHYRSIVESNNELSHALLYNLGTFREYKQLMLDTYGDYTPEQIPDEAMTRNLYTTGFMMDVLQYLYPISDQYPELMEHLNAAMPGYYFKKYVTNYPIAHKYGSYEGAENDVGIVYTEEPYLLAVYTYGVYDGMDVVGRINEAVCAYNVNHYQPEPVPEPIPESVPETAPVPEPTPEPEPEPTREPVSDNSSPLPPLTLLGLIGAILCLVFMIPGKKD